LLYRAIERVAAQAFAVHLADEVGRHLARTEAWHADLRRNALNFLVDPRLDVLGGDGQHEGALQALVLGFDGLDGHSLNNPSKNFRPLRDGQARQSLGLRARGHGAGGGTRTPTVSHLDLNQARLPISPRPRRTLKGCGPITGGAGWATRSDGARWDLKGDSLKCSSHQHRESPSPEVRCPRCRASRPLLPRKHQRAGPTSTCPHPALSRLRGQFRL